MTRERAIAIAQCVTVLVFMSLGNVLSKMALREVAPMTFTYLTIAVGLAAMVIYTFVIRRERIPQLSRKVWIYILAIGFFNFVIGRIPSTFALQAIPASTHSYLTNFIGFITMGMSIFILRESPTLFQVLGAVVAFSGLRVFFIETPPPEQVTAALLILVGISGVAFTNNIARKLAILTENKLSNNIISTLAIMFGGSITILVGLITSWPPRLGSLADLGVILYSGLISTAIGLTVWNLILRTLRSYEASILGASTVIWTALLAVPILGERLAINQIIGIGLMLTGLILVQVRRGKLSVVFGRMPWTKRA